MRLAYMYMYSLFIFLTSQVIALINQAQLEHKQKKMECLHQVHVHVHYVHVHNDIHADASTYTVYNTCMYM